MEPIATPQPINPTAAATLDAIEQRNTPDVLPMPAPQTELDIAQGAPVPGEMEAYRAWDSLTKAKQGIMQLDPQLQQTFTQQWTTYRDTVKANGQILFPTITRKHYAAIADNENRLLGGLDKLLDNIPPEKRVALEKRLAAFPEPARKNELARTANYALFQQQYGQKFKPEAYPAFRDRYARQVLGLKDDTSDLAVYNALHQRKQEQQKADQFLDEQANQILPKLMATRDMNLVREFEKQARATLSPELADAASMEMRYMARQARMQAKAVEPIATALTNWMKWDQGRADAITGQEKQSKPIGSLADATDRFQKLTPEQKDIVNTIIRENIASMGDDPDNLLQRMVKRMGNAGIDLLQSGVNMASATMAEEAANTERMVDRVSNNARMMFGMAPEAPRTAKQDAATSLDNWIRDSAFLRQSSGSISQKFNKSDGWVKKSALLVSDQLPFMVAATSGIGGLALTSVAMAGQSYESARIRNPEGNRTAQLQSAAVSGTAQAAVERLSTQFAFRFLGAVPGFRSTFGAKFGSESLLRLARLENRLGRAAAGATLGAVSVGGVEYGEEIVQEAIDRTFQDLAMLPTGITDDQGNPTTIGRNLLEVLKSYNPTTEKGSKLLLTLLPFMLIGGGGGSFAAFRNGEMIRRNRPAMRAMGLPEPVIEQISTTPDVEKANTLLKQALDTEIHMMQKSQAELHAAATLDYVTSIENAWRAQGIEIINPQFDDAGNMLQVELTTPAGTSVHASVEEAQQALSDYATEQQNEMLENATEAYATEDIVKFMTEDGQRNAADDLNTRVTQNDFVGTFPELLKRNLISSETMRARLEAFALQEGITLPEALASMEKGGLAIKAQNFAKLNHRGAWQYVVNLFRGADPINALEDFAEVFWKAVINEGIITPQKLIEFIRQTEQSTGNTYLKEGFEFFTGEDNMPLWEALGAISREHALANYKHSSLPPSFRKWIETMLTIAGEAWNWFKSMMRGRELQAAIESGQIPRQFAEMIADSVGINEQNRANRVMQREADQARAEFEETGYKLSEWAKGKLLHPAQARAMNHPLARELERIYDELTVYHHNREARNVGNRGRLKEYRKNVSRAEAYFAPRTEKVNMDNLRGSANEVGFQFENIADMLDAIEESLFFNRETYSTHSGIMQESFSISPNPTNPTNPSDSRAQLDNASTMGGMPLPPNENTAPANRDGGNQVPDTTQSPQDLRYLELAKNPEANREELQKMVKEAAMAANYTVKVFRGHNASIDPMKATKVRDSATWTTDQEIAEIYGSGSSGKVSSAFINQSNIFDFSNEGRRLSKDETVKFLKNLGFDDDYISENLTYSEADGFKGVDFNDAPDDAYWMAYEIADLAWFRSKIHAMGHSGIHYTGDHEGSETDEYRFFSPTQIKSADPVTYDEQGNIIPLSQRFDPTKESISFSLSRTTQSNLQSIIEARLSRGPEERVKILETMRDRLQGLTAKFEARNAGDLTPMERQLLGWRGRELTPAQAERLRIEDAIATVKGLLSAVPAEIRAKVSVPLTRILDADTDVKTYNAFRELIQNADEVIEEELKETYTERITALLDTARPTSTEARTNKTLLTPETQRAINQIGGDSNNKGIVEMAVQEIMLAEVQAEATMATLENELEQADDAELIQNLQTKMAELRFWLNDLSTFGNLGSQSSSELAQAYAKLRDIYIKGRTARRIIDADYRREIAANRADLLASIGLPNGVTGPEYDRATKANTYRNFKAKAKAILLEHLNFHQFIDLIFPVSTTTMQWSERAIKAMRGTTRRRIAAEKRFNEFMAQRLGAKSLTERGRIIEALSERKTRDIMVSEARMKNETVPIEAAEKILKGTMKISWSNDRLSMAQLQQAWRDYLALPKSNRARTKNLKIQIVEYRTQPQAIAMSDLEMLDVLMTNAQEMYQSNLDRYGFNEQVIAQIRNTIDKRALAIGEFLRSEYDAGWFEMNPVFSRMFHMEMPRIRNYAPGSFATSDAEKSFLPNELGNAGNASAMSAGATKNRRAHMARPTTTNALSKYFAHVDQSSYWIEWAELVKEINATLRTPEMRRAIEARHGKDAYNDIRQWINYLNLDGASAAQEKLASDDWIGKILTSVSNRGLSWNLSVPFKQFSAALGSVTMEDPREATKSFARILYNWDSVKAVFESEAIQQRLERGFAPEIRQLLDSTKLTPSGLMRLLNAGHLPAGYADAVFTTISGFVSYDITYRRERKFGRTHEQAQLVALERMDRVVALTSQPVDTQMKSLSELRNAKGFARSIFMFKSDTRRALASVLYAAWKNKQGNMSNEQFASVLITQWFMYGLLGSVGTAVFKSLAQDDDDDTDYWEWERLVIGALLGPIEGFIFVGVALSTLMKLAMGEKSYLNSTNPFDPVTQLVSKMRSEKDFFTKGNYIDDFSVITNAIAVITSGLGIQSATILPVASRFLDQIVTIGSNDFDDADERERQSLREFNEMKKEQKATLKDTDDELYQKAKAATGSERDAVLSAIADEKQRRRIRERIKKEEAMANMTEVEKDLAAKNPTERAEAAAYMLKQKPESERAPFRNRMSLLFNIQLE